MKIAIHQPRVSYFYGGGERVPLEQASHFFKLGHDVSIITTEVNNKSELFLDFQKNNPGVKVISFEPSQKLKKIYRMELGQSRYRADAESLEFGRMTKEFYLKNQFDIVAMHYTVDSLYIPKNQFVVLELHGCPSRRRIIDAKSIERADALVTVAEYVGNFWKQMHSIKRPVHLTYNGIDSSYYTPKETQKIYDLLYVGRLIKIKGVDDLLHSVKNIAQNFPAVKIAIIGKGPESDRLHALAKKLNVNSIIDWKSSISDDELLGIYRASKIGVFPSTAKEGVLTTILEAASCEIAVITTNSCGMPEFLKNGRNGLLVEPHDISGLTSAIEKLLNDDNFRNVLGKKARVDIVHHWKWETRVKELIKVYKQCLKK